MPKAEPFERHTGRYDRWFEAHQHAYTAELAAVDAVLPETDRALEIGVGSGRFAAPLGIKFGLDPAAAMLDRARDRGIDVVRGVAEALPIRDRTFGAALIVTTICFVDDVPMTLAEAHRVLEPGGRVVIGFVDRESPLGQRYQAHREENPFYREATFVSTEELTSALEDGGFVDLEFVQTVFRTPEEMTEPDPVEAGFGEGSFVVVGAATPGTGSSA